MRRVVPLLLFTLVAGSVFGQSSTPEQRKWAVDTAKWLEEHPTSPDAKQRSADLIKWWIAVPDLTLSVCPILLDVKNKRVGPLVATQAMFSTGAYLIEHSDASRADLVSAGVEGALRAYVNAVSADEKMRDPFLDQLVAAQKEGKLKDAYVDGVVKHCDEGDAKRK